LTYFQIRQLYEAQRFDQLSKANLDALRDLRRRFGQPSVAGTATRWPARAPPRKTGQLPRQVRCLSSG
jgi:hypothetical protein